MTRLLALSCIIAVGCGEPRVLDLSAGDVEGRSKDDDSSPLTGAPAGAKADGPLGLAGPPAGLTQGAATQVWAVQRAWEDVDADGLDHNEKYAAWVRSLPRLEVDPKNDTFAVVTPFGFSLPAPSVECAEASVLLRVLFASWYGLPFYITAWEEGRGALHFGHFGVWTDEGPDPRFPSYRTKYPDYSGADASEPWPVDARLSRRQLTKRGDDANPWLAPGAHAGAWFDRVLLNKRVGHFLHVVLTWTGSMHLASAENTFDIVPEALREGDTLLHRWQRKGIGHTMVTKRVEPMEVGGQAFLKAEVVSGSMPRVQPHWEDALATKMKFTAARGGGEGTGWGGDLFADLGGGIKRWRVAVVIDGRWRNVVPESDRDVYIPRSDIARLAARPEQFQGMLGDASPEAKRDLLLELIEAKRRHLREHPASCSARTGREEAFQALYAVMEELGSTRDQVDSLHRTLEDRVFAELVYPQSRTCCWNSSTAAMYTIVMDLATSLAQADGACAEPPVFRMEDGGYERFEQHAEAMDISDAWVPWSADEPCAWADSVTTDTIAPSEVAPLCVDP